MLNNYCAARALGEPAYDLVVMPMRGQDGQETQQYLYKVSSMF